MDTGTKEFESLFYTAPKVLKYVTAAAIFFCNFGTGIMMAIPGPAINSFSHKYNTSLTHVSKVLTVIPACYTAGALSAILMFRYINRQVGVTFVLFLVSVGITLLPLMPSVETFFAAGGIVGLGFGVFDPAQLAWTIDIWRDDAGPFILTNNFFYAAGNLAAPLILESFLPDEEIATAIANGALHEDPTLSMLYVPFAITGGVVLTCAIVMLVLLIYYRTRSTKAPQTQTCSEIQLNAVDQEDSEGETSAVKKLPVTTNVIIVVLTCFFIAFYQSMEVTTLQFISVFVQNSEIALSEREASRILTAITIGFAGGRGVGIPLVLKIPPQFLLVGNIVLMLVGNTLLLCLGGSSVTWMWIGGICLGLGFSTTFAAFFTFLEKYIFVSDAVAAMASASTGVMVSVYPLILGEWIEQYPKLLNYCDYLNISVLIVSFSVLLRFTYFRHSKR